MSVMFHRRTRLVSRKKTTGNLVVASLACFLCHAGYLKAGIPEEILITLGSGNFAAREEAQKALEDWALQNEGNSAVDLIRVSHGHPVAEVRVRTLAVLRVLARRDYESSGQGYLGIRMKDDAVAIPGKGNQPVPVVVVSEVVPDSAAFMAGLQVGDAIVSIDGKGWDVANEGQSALLNCMERIKALKPRTQVRFSILRNGHAMEIPVTLARRPAALNDPFADPTLGEVEKVETTQRELHFKKWLLERKDDR